jgi:hypothetical protein
MLSLQAWLGQTWVACKFESIKLELFAKVGGKYLGNLWLPGFKEGIATMAKVLMDLQEQAMHLMPHEWCARTRRRVLCRCNSNCTVWV